MNQTKQRCKCCGLPEYYTKITFNQEGICNYCNFYAENKSVLENSSALKTAFQKKIEKAKEKAKEAGAKYDCLVGFSGGKDSTYIIYQLKKKYGMRVLAFTFDNGFSTEYGTKNIKNALEKLDIDHITFSLNDKELRKNYATCVKFLHNFCAVCFHYMHYYSYLFAGQYQIPMIVNGRSRGQMLQCADSRKLLEPFETSYSLLEFEHQMFHGLEQKLYEAGKADYLNDIRAEAVSYFAYHDIDEEDIMCFLEEEIGWVRSKGSSGHGDCYAHAMAENLSIQKRGFPIRLGELAVAVRRGKLTVEEMDYILEKDNNNFSVLEEAYRKKFGSRIDCDLTAVKDPTASYGASSLLRSELQGI